MEPIESVFESIFKNGSNDFMTAIKPDKKKKKKGVEPRSSEYGFESNPLRIIDLHNIKYRGDYNGKPCAYVIDKSNLLLRTHPLYCSSYLHYGRIYHYRWLSLELSERESPKFRDDFCIYVHDSMLDCMDAEVVNIVNALETLEAGKRILIDSTETFGTIFIEHWSFDASSLNSTITSSKMPDVAKLKKDIDRGILPAEEIGFIQYKTKFFRIYEDGNYEADQEDHTIAKSFHFREDLGQDLSCFRDRVISKCFNEETNAFVGFVHDHHVVTGFVFSDGGDLKIAYHDL